MNFTKKIYKRDARTLLPIGVLITNIGNGMYTLAIGKLLFDKTGATSSFALLIILETIIKFSTQAIASLAVDNGRAKQSAFIADIIRGLTIILSGIFIYLGHPEILIVTTLIKNLMSPFYRTASFAIGPLIAEGQSLARYNARTSTYMQVGQLLGAGIAGIIMTFFSPAFAIVTNGISYIISALCMAIAIIPCQTIFSHALDSKKKFISIIKPSEFFSEWLEIIKLIFKDITMLGLVLLCTADYVIISFINMSYAPMLKATNSSAWVLSIWDSFFAIGAILGAILFGYLKSLQINLKWVPAFLIAEGITILSFGLGNSILISICMFLLGLSNSISVSSFNYALQTNAAKKLHGRISGIRQLFISLATTIIIPILSYTLSRSILAASLTMLIICIIFSLGIFAMLKPLLSEKGVDKECLRN